MELGDAVKAGKYGTFKTFVEGTSKRLGSLKTGLISAGGGVRSFFRTITNLNVGLGELAKTKIGGFFSSIGVGFQNMDSGIQSAFERGADSATKFANTAKTRISNFASSAVKALQNISSKNPFEAIAKGSGALKEAAGKAALSIRDGLKSKLTAKNASSVFKGVKNGISAVSGSVVRLGRAAASTGWRSLLFSFDTAVVASQRLSRGFIVATRAVGSLLRGIGSLGMAFIYWEVVEGIVMTIVNTMTSLWKAVSGMLGPLTELGQAMGSAIATGDWAGLQSTILATVDVIKMTFFNFIDDSTARIMNWYTDVKEIFLIFWEPLVTTFNGVYDIVTKGLNGLWGFFRNTFRNIGEYIDSVFGWNPFEAFFGDATDGANDFFSSFAGILTAIAARIQKVGITLANVAKKASITAQFGFQKWDKYSAAAQLRKEIDMGGKVMGTEAGQNFVRRRELSADIGRSTYDEEEDRRSFDSDKSKELLHKLMVDVTGRSATKEEFEAEAKARGGYMELWDHLNKAMDKAINLDLQKDSKHMVGQYKGTYLKNLEDKKAAKAYQKVDDMTFQKMKKWEANKREKNTRREDADKRIAAREDEAAMIAKNQKDRIATKQAMEKQQGKQDQDKKNLESLSQMFGVGFNNAWTEANRLEAAKAKEKVMETDPADTLSKIGGFNASALMAQTRGATPMKAIEVQKEIAETAGKQLEVLAQINDHFSGIARGLGLL
jgi:hypothetical protein